MRPAPRHERRGAESVEFALTMPVLLVLLFALTDYGMLFWQRLQSTSSLVDAVRLGAMTRPTDAEIASNFGCAECEARIQASAAAALAAIPVTYDADSLTPVLESFDGICVLRVDARITFDPLIGLVPTPDDYVVTIRQPAQAVKGC